MSADLFVIEPRWTVQVPHLRCTLKRALALQSTRPVWSEAEDVNNAVMMVHGVDLPDSGRLFLTRSQLHTLKIAIEWRRENRAASNGRTAPDILAQWKEIEDQIIETHQDASRAEELHRVC
ncbi:hypothetical protein ACWGIB_10855 [Streptomyces xiamenensis]